MLILDFIGNCWMDAVAQPRSNVKRRRPAPYHPRVRERHPAVPWKRTAGFVLGLIRLVQDADPQALRGMILPRDGPPRNTREVLPTELILFLLIFFMLIR